MAAMSATVHAAGATPPADNSIGDGLFSRPDGIEARRGRVLMRVTALTDQIVRVRIARDGVLPEDASWAVLPAMRAQRAPVRPLQSGFATAAIQAVVDPASLGLTITDASGKVIVTDAPSPLSLDGRSFTLRKALPLGEHIFGLGDKTGGRLDRRGKSTVDLSTDDYGLDNSGDPD